MTRGWLAVALLVLAVACVGPSPSAQGEKATQVDMQTLDIIPGKSIGTVRLGMSRSELPARAQVSGSVGVLDGVSFELVGDTVADAWIEDVRTFAGEVRLQSKVIAKDIQLESLKQLVGPCEPVSTKGGVFFNCSGVAVGTDFEGKGDFIQIRLKPR